MSSNNTERPASAQRKFERQGQELVPHIDWESIDVRFDKIRFVSRGISSVHPDSKGLHLCYIKRGRLPGNFWMVTPIQEANDLEVLAVIETKHAINPNNPDEFDPTAEEYLRQVPMELIKDVAAIEFTSGMGHVRVLDGMHVARTTLYKRKAAESSAA